ncbi:MAG: radical SAM protein [Gammaproteobacteria bacterium]|nr:radical SAM protein [Gammaproteobacteria bacterium]
MILHYQQPLYRPPSEGNNLIIQATLGCSYNQCSFCSMYRSKQYMARPVDAVIQDIQQAARQWPDAHRVFLADGDALTLPTSHLLEILIALQQALPRLARVSCYATPANLLRKTESELNQLSQHKLNLLYLGIESGDNRTLKKITKGASQKGMAEALIKADQCNMKVSATVILGLAGQNDWQQHINGTVELLNQAPVSYLSTLQLYLEADQQVEFLQKYGDGYVASEDQHILQELARLINGIQPPKAIIFRSNHASNALALAGNLPRDKDKLLLQIQQVQAGGRPLRPDYLRGL